MHSGFSCFAQMGTMAKFETEPFAIERPTRLRFPAVFSSPHSGCEYPESFLKSSKLCPRTLRTSEDCYIAELFSGVTKLGCPLLHANFPRAYLDANREPYELDQAMFADALPAFANTVSARVSGGLGTIPRIVAENREIYARLLTWPEAKRRIDTLYHPYHEALKSLLSAAVRRFGAAVLIDCHSMPSTAVQNTFGLGGKRADIVLGDRYGSTCDVELSAYLAELFGSAGLVVARNKPYAGGYITQTYGRSGHAKQALQIELNRGLYMNERTLERSREFYALQELLCEVLAAFLPHAGTLRQPPAIAAE